MQIKTAIKKRGKVQIIDIPDNVMFVYDGVSSDNESVLDIINELYFQNYVSDELMFDFADKIDSAYASTVKNFPDSKVLVLLTSNEDKGSLDSYVLPVKEDKLGNVCTVDGDVVLEVKAN